MITKIRRLFTADTLAQKGYLNSIALLIDYGARIIVALVTTPILESGLGKGMFGTWVLLTRIITYMDAAGGRPTQALQAITANQQHTTDEETKRRAVGSALVIWVLFLPLLLTLGAITVWQFPVWYKVTASEHYVTRIAIIILVAYLIFINLGDIPRAVLVGENKGYRRMGLSAFTVLLGGAGMVLSVRMGWGLIGLSLSLMISMMLAAVLFLQVTFKHIPWFGVARPKRDEVMKLLKLSGWFMLWQLIWQFISFGDVLLLGYFVDNEAVGIYMPYRYAPQTVVGLIAAAISGVMPGLGGIIGEGDFKKASKIRSEMFILTWFAITLFGTVMLLCNRSFVDLWIDEPIYIGMWPMILMVVILMIMMFSRHDSVIIDYTLDVRDRMLMSIFSVIVTLITSTILFRTYDMGLTGLLIGFLVGRIILIVSYPYFVAKAFHISYINQYIACIRPALCTIALFTVGAILGEQLPLLTLPQLFLIAIVGTVVTIGITLSVGLSAVQRRLIIGRIQGVLKQN